MSQRSWGPGIAPPHSVLLLMLTTIRLGSRDLFSCLLLNLFICLVLISRAVHSAAATHHSLIRVSLSSHISLRSPSVQVSIPVPFSLSSFSFCWSVLGAGPHLPSLHSVYNYLIVLCFVLVQSQLIKVLGPKCSVCIYCLLAMRTSISPTG